MRGVKAGRMIDGKQQLALAPVTWTEGAAKDAVAKEATDAGIYHLQEPKGRCFYCIPSIRKNAVHAW